MQEIPIKESTEDEEDFTIKEIVLGDTPNMKALSRGQAKEKI